MKVIYFSFLVLYSYHVLSVSIHPLESDQNEQQTWPAGQMNNTIFRTSNKYFCAAVNDSYLNLIMYGTNTWRFPTQDINLTLRYPTTNKEECSVGDDVLITGFKVVLNTNGEGSNGFIVGGGILQDTITLSFTSSNISLIEYRFWVYGINKDTGHMYGLNPFSTVHYMC